ncbi:hypothetical protein KRMM14A1004_48370 [Krasilnikovia sp. MM14-A1004]
MLTVLAVLAALVAVPSVLAARQRPPSGRLIHTAAAIQAAAPPRYLPHDVALAARPYNDGSPLPRRSVGRVDTAGVRMFASPVLTGGRPMNHPVGQAQYGLALLNTYRLTGDQWFLDMAARQGQRLVLTHVESRGAWWFPYRFDFPLASGLGRTMPAPWYSAMAQGQALSLFTRLAEVTGWARWRVAAAATFASLRLGYRAGAPWAVWRDGNAMLWLEEYPGPVPTASARVLNGHIFATFGVWDYWRSTRSAQAAAIFNDAVTTVRRYALDGFRNRGAASRYSLSAPNTSEKYHLIHTRQLMHLHALTADPVFAAMAETLQTDFPAPVQSARVLFRAGRHIGVMFRGVGDGRVTRRLAVTVSRLAVVPADLRRRIAGQPGYWYHLTAGPLRGYWVLEAAPARASLGPVAAVPYFGLRRVFLAAGTFTAYTAAGSRSISLHRQSSAPAAAAGWIRGLRAVQIGAGPLRGYWLPLSRATTLS